MSAKRNLQKTLLGIAAAAGLLSFLLQPAQAATIFLTQHWELRGNPLDTLRTTALFDDTAVTPVGQTFILLERFSVLHAINGVGQSFELAQFTVPPSLAVEGNSFAFYNNGAFVGLGNVDLGGAGRVPLVEQTTFRIFASYIVNRDSLFRFIDPSGTFRYNLVSSEFRDLSAVPGPATLPLFASGLGLIGFLRWRRKRVARKV